MILPLPIPKLSPAALKALAIVGLLAAAWGWHVMDKRAAIEAHAKAATAERYEAIADYVVHMSGRVAAQRIATETARVEIRTRTKTLIQEVPIYVSTAAENRCALTLGFVRLYDTAWGVPTIPVAADRSLDDPAGIPLARLAAVNAANAGAAREWQAEALAWREWYARERAEYERRFAQPGGGAVGR